MAEECGKSPILNSTSKIRHERLVLKMVEERAQIPRNSMSHPQEGQEIRGKFLASSRPKPRKSNYQVLVPDLVLAIEPLENL